MAVSDKQAKIWAVNLLTSLLHNAGQPKVIFIFFRFLSAREGTSLVRGRKGGGREGSGLGGVGGVRG